MIITVCGTTVDENIYEQKIELCHMKFNFGRLMLNDSVTSKIQWHYYAALLPRRGGGPHNNATEFLT